jgi:hypothetical protein
LFGAQNNFFSLLFISRDYISLQASCEIFVVWLARLGGTASHSVYSDIRIQFIYSRCYILLFVIGIHFVPNHCHPFDLWTFQIGHWIRPIGPHMNFRKRTFKHWIHNRSCGKHQNKWSRLGAAKVFTARSTWAENSEPAAFFGGKEGFGTISTGITGLFVSCWWVHSFSHHHSDQWAAKSHITRSAFTNRCTALH